MLLEDPARYTLLEKIGAGGVGEVHLAQDTRLRRKVALKFLSDEAAADEQTRRRFVLEARSAAAIDHPFVCKVYEAGELDGRAYIAMEYIDGRPLDEWLTSDPSWEDRLKVAIEVAEAVHEAHSKGFLHLDLKPTNLMVTAGGHPKVLDFGIAKQIDPLAARDEGRRQLGSFIGTPDYLSPEQAAGDPIDLRSDIFSFGIVLYEMFTGVNPFRRETPVRSAMAIVARAAGSIRDHDPALPATLDEIIGRMLCKEPDERFASMAEVRTALGELAPPGGRPVETAPASVAVLPFSRISASQEDDYFVDGMVEEIISRLSRIGGLKVISRTSVMQYKDHTEELGAIGKRLGVTTVVEGSVRRAADRFRVAARLVTVDSGQQLWSEVYDRPVGDLFAVQDDVSEEIASALRLKLSANTRRRMTGARAETLETYNEYLKARYSMNKWTPEGIETGIRHFKRAVALDPEFARGYAGLSICHAYSGHLGYVPFNVAFPAAKQAADQALQLDDTLAEAHTSLALVSLLHEWDWTAADRHFRNAVELDPNSSATHLHYSWCFLAQGQPDRAISEASLAVTLDPLSASNQMVMGWVQFYSGLYVESLVHYRKALELEPDHTLTRNQIGGTYVVLGRHDEAIEMLQDPVNPMHLAWVYAIAGRREEGERLVEKLRAGGGKTPVTNMDLGVFHLLTGDLDDGFRLLDEAYEERDSRLPYMPDHPFLTQVRSDPRMTRLRDRIGLYADPV